MYSLLSDIHGNLEALEAVLQDLRGMGVQETLCLGDVVGYGPNPGECVDRAMNFKVVLAGNHEEGVLKGPLGFSALARESAVWTRKQLKPLLRGLGEKRARWDFLKGLPLRHTQNGNLYVHASPRDPTQEYILPSDTEVLFGGLPEKLKNIFRYFDNVWFVGHTHLPGIITEDFDFFPLSEIGFRWKIEKGKKIVVNVGSVGQPRDGDSRACYVVQDGDQLYFRRVSYNMEATIEKIRGIPQLDDRNGERLRYGA